MLLQNTTNKLMFVPSKFRCTVIFWQISGLVNQSSQIFSTQILDKNSKLVLSEISTFFPSMKCVIKINGQYVDSQYYMWFVLAGGWGGKFYTVNTFLIFLNRYHSVSNSTQERYLKRQNTDLNIVYAVVKNINKDSAKWSTIWTYSLFS